MEGSQQVLLEAGRRESENLLEGAGPPQAWPSATPCRAIRALSEARQSRGTDSLSQVSPEGPEAGRRNLQPRADTKEGHKVKESSQGSGRLGPGMRANRTVTLRTRKRTREVVGLLLGADDTVNFGMI